MLNPTDPKDNTGEGPQNAPIDMPRILDHLRTYVTVVSSTRAQEILDTQNWSRQRDISERWANDLRMAILKGELTFLTLVFAELPNGERVLVDGQHRLTALAQLTRSLEAHVTVHRVTTERDLGELYLKYDRSWRRGPDVALKATGVLDRSPISPAFVRRMSGAVSIVRSGFSKTYKADRSLIDTADAVEAWLPEIEKFHEAIAGAAASDRRKLMRAPVAAIALATFRHQPDVAVEFWTRTASQEMLGMNDPRRILMTWLRERSNTGFGGRDILYCCYVAHAWSAHFEGRTLKILKVSDTSAPVRLTGVSSLAGGR